jgi:hypothetical protein
MGRSAGVLGVDRFKIKEHVRALDCGSAARATLRSCAPVPVPTPMAPSTRPSTRMGMPPTRLVHLFSCATVTWISISAPTPPVGSFGKRRDNRLVARLNHREGLGSIHAQAAFEARASSTWKTARIIRPLLHLSTRLAGQRRLRRLGLIERTTSTGGSSFRPMSLAVSRALSTDGPSPMGSIVDDREGAHRRARAALELQRRAEELELALAEKFLKIDQPFPVRNPEFTAQAVLGEDVVGRLVG